MLNVLSLLFILFAFAACGDSGGSASAGSKGILTFDYIPTSQNYAVGVFNHSGSIDSLRAWTDMQTRIIAAGSRSASNNAITLYAAGTNDVFSSNGNFMIALYTTTEPIAVLYKADVNFSNGSASVEYDTLVDLFSGGGSLTIKNLYRNDGGPLAVAIYDYDGEIASMADMAQALTSPLAVSYGLAAPTNSSSPYSIALMKHTDELRFFDMSGTYLITMVESGAANTYFLEQVAFQNGRGEADFSSFDIVGNLPLTDPSTDPDYIIGPAGGIVFYDKGDTADGWRYLEAAPYKSEFTAEWGDEGSIGAMPTDVGTGKENTQLISTKLSELGQSGKAAQLCESLDIGGYDDWFLPSRDELSLMNQNLKKKGWGRLKNAHYWSSSSFTAVYFWAFNNPDYDGQSGTMGSMPMRVRAIRRY